jgi:hypothetical protein
VLADPCHGIPLVYVVNAKRCDSRLSSQFREIRCCRHCRHAGGIQSYESQDVVASLNESPEWGVGLHVRPDEDDTGKYVRDTRGRFQLTVFLLGWAQSASRSIYGPRRPIGSITSRPPVHRSQSQHREPFALYAEPSE